MPEALIGEPGSKEANPVEPDDNPNRRTVKQGSRQTGEPTPTDTEQGTCETGEPFRYGAEIETDILSNQTRLWRLGAYVDRHGKPRARRILRFVPNPPTREIGQVTRELAEELKQRPGRGNWSASRDESAQFKRAAEYVAESFRRDKRLWRKRPILQRTGRLDNPTVERGDMPKPQDDALWDDVPNVLM